MSPSNENLDFDEVKRYFDEVMKQYQDLLGTLGPALMMVFEPLLRRYNAGERTRDLYDAMKGVE